MPASTSTPPLILIVDDEQLVRTILHRMVKKFAAHCDVLEAANSNEALTQIAAHHISLMITDYSMPGLNGIELAQAVKAVSPHIRVAIISGYVGGDLAAAAKDGWVDYVLAKPFQQSELMHVLEASLRP